MKMKMILNDKNLSWPTEQYEHLPWDGTTCVVPRTTGMLCVWVKKDEFHLEDFSPDSPPPLNDNAGWYVLLWEFLALKESLESLIASVRPPANGFWCIEVQPTGE